MKKLSTLLLFLILGISLTRQSESVLAGYTRENVCNCKINQAMKNGLNVVNWSFIDLLDNSTTLLPYVNSRTSNATCISGIVAQMKAQGIEAKHYVSVGGWYGPHPGTHNSAEVVYQSWKEWNENFMARPDVGFNGFDGIAWDLEGTDNKSDPNNHFTPECMDLIGEFSQLAKKDGYHVSMAPAESYLDVTTSAFDLSLLHNYTEWESREPSFNYHGHNTYAYLVAKYAKTCVEGEEVNTFDHISIQLYEGWSHANYNITILGQDPVDFLVKYVQQVLAGWYVDFSSTPSVNFPSQVVKVEQSQLVIGLSNAWADGKKFLFIKPEDVEKAHEILKGLGQEPSGYMYWDIESEGLYYSLTDSYFYITKELNKFMNIRSEEVETS